MQLNRLVFQMTLGFLLALLALHAHPGQAQMVHSYASGSNGSVGSATPCSAPLVRNFYVTDTFVLGDVDLGVHVSHSTRGDVRLTLQSPAGTRVQLVDGGSHSITGNNLNAVLNDEASQTVNTSGTSANHSNSAPPFQNNFRANNALSAFDGQTATGTWRLELCDTYTTADNGTFRYAELYLTEAVADLSLTQTASATSPQAGTNITFSLTVSSGSSSHLAANGVIVSQVLSPGLVFVSAVGYGTYDANAGTWTLPTISPGQVRSIQIVANVASGTAGTQLISYGQIASSPLPDPDSVPGNFSLSEDDEGVIYISVPGSRIAGTPPALICPKGSVVLDWDGVTWTAGALSRTLSVAALGNVAFQIISDGTAVTSSPYGGKSPTRSTTISGGIVGAGSALVEYFDHATVAGATRTVITLPTVLPGLQFKVFGIDYSAGQYADRLKVTGSRGGIPVVPVLTNGAANYVVASEAFGDATSGDTQSLGNVTVTFGQPIDTFTLEFGSHAVSLPNPAPQRMAIHDIMFCKPDATLTVTKTTTLVSDPVNATSNPAVIPGAVLNYCITIANTGSATAQNVLASDQLPGYLSYILGSLTSGANCASATMAEDDNAAGIDETDPLGASFGSSIMTLRSTQIAAGATAAFRFKVQVN